MGGFDGVIIKYENNEIEKTSQDIEFYNNISNKKEKEKNDEKEEQTFWISSGASNGYVGNYLMTNGYSGFEFASGIPGTIGGAIYMNAGAYGGEIADILVSCLCIDLFELKIYNITNIDCKFSYRKSIFQNNRYFIIGGYFKFKKDDKEKIKSKMEELREKRFSSQPLEYPSAGSTFKRNENVIVSKLIDEAGLKGKKIGGAEVSTKHAGFIINKENATSKDIEDLIKYVKKEIHDKYNVDIQEEVRIIGDEEKE